MQNNRAIGGEFDIDLQCLLSTQIEYSLLEKVYTYSSGRSALYYILIDVQKRYGITTLYLPEYLCSSILIAAEKSDMKVVFCPLTDLLEFDMEKFPLKENEKAAVLIINYFGLKNLQIQVEKVKTVSRKAVIIEDDVQAFFEFCSSDQTTDYKFTSLRKTLACPDGGLVKTANALQSVLEVNRFHQFKLAGGILKSLYKPEYYGDDVYLHLFEKGEGLLDKEITKGMSRISQDLLKRTDTERVAALRKNNARYILDGLKTLGVNTILPVLKDKTPLFVPVWLEERDKVRKQLFQHQVFCPVHWPLEGMNIQKGAEMAEHEMSIIIDQRYDQTDMDRMLTILEKALK